MTNLDFDKWIVIPWFSTGSTGEGTRRYVWKARFAKRGFNPRFVAGQFPDSIEGETAAVRLAGELTERNEPF